MGRPSKLTPETAAAIVAAVESGDYPEVAAECEGVPARTFYKWMARGETEGDAAEDEPYRQFRQEVTRARAKAESTMVSIVRVDAAKNAESARWYLERSAADRWGRRDKLTIETAVNAELDAMLGKLEAGLAPDEYERVLAVLAGRSAGAEASAAPGDAPTTH